MDQITATSSQADINPGHADADLEGGLPFMQNRELSWLAFDKRVLDQGADPTVPLLDRLNFISIFWSNLQEFFMVRVGSLTDLSLLKKTIIDTKSGMTPAEQLGAIYRRCHELYPSYERTYEDLRALLRAEGVVHLLKQDLSAEQKQFLDTYMRNEVMPFLSPQIINARHPFPHLENGGLYIVVRLDEKAKKSKGKNGKDAAAANAKDKSASKAAKAAKNLGAEGVTLGLVPLPRHCDRIVQLPGKGLQFILLEHVIEMYAADVFSMYKVKHTNIICVTRNADIDATEATDESDDDYREHMKRILKKRARLAPVRLESETPLSSTVKPLLLDRLKLKDHQTFVCSVPLDLSYTYDLAGRVNTKKRAALTRAPFTPQWPACLDRNRPVIEQVTEREMLFHYPYETMDAFVQLLREAAADPSVLSIKITLYRLASQSHLAEALIAAAEAGKEVTALFELRARFDEFNNIEWSQRFEQAGCRVIYGFRNFKVHSKICTITRQTPQGLQHITQLGTGNYNEKTARLYTDYAFITTDPSIGRDAAMFFRNMALENTSNDYDILWVAPLQIKPKILEMIDEQIARARAGEPAGLFFKTNSITDKEMIDKLVEASQAGVPCTLLVRGISCLVPGVPGKTDNIRVVSIVGRLLEHSRIYCFGPRDNCKIYLSSADLMTRNMEKRIEIAWPVLGEELHDEILGYLDICLSDTAKLRELLPDKTYTPLGYYADRNEEGEALLFDSQDFLVKEAQRQHLAAAESSAANAANRERTAKHARVVENGTVQSPEVASERSGGRTVVAEAAPSAPDAMRAKSTTDTASTPSATETTCAEELPGRAEATPATETEPPANAAARSPLPAISAEGTAQTPTGGETVSPAVIIESPAAADAASGTADEKTLRGEAALAPLPRDNQAAGEKKKGILSRLLGLFRRKR